MTGEKPAVKFLYCLTRKKDPFVWLRNGRCGFLLIVIQKHSHTAGGTIGIYLQTARILYAPCRITLTLFTGRMKQKSRRSSTGRDALFEGPATEYGLDIYEFLWWRVLYQAINDADNLDNTNVTKRNQAKEAIIWLMRDIRDFEMVCLAARPRLVQRTRCSMVEAALFSRTPRLGVRPRRRNGGAKLR